MKPDKTVSGTEGGKPVPPHGWMAGDAVVKYDGLGFLDPWRCEIADLVMQVSCRRFNE
jgi:hypothetical protein